MNGLHPSLIAAEGVTTTFQFGRIHAPEDWLAPLGATALVVTYVVWMYLRDAGELRAPIAWLLTALRTLAFIGLLVIWLQPQWRNQENVMTPSRVVVLVDTSLSMSESATAPDLSGGVGIARPGSDGADTGAADAGPSVAAPGSRAGDAVRFFQSPWLQNLLKTHEVHVTTFDSVADRPAATLPRVSSNPAAAAPSATKPEVVFVKPTGSKPAGTNPSGSAVSGSPDTNRADSGKVVDARQANWPVVLAPRGPETRLGEAVSQALLDHRSARVSGIIVLSDGGWNTGVDPQDAIKAARAEKIPVPPVMTVGIGSAEEVKNVRVQDLAAPARTYPNDQFAVKAYLQAQGMEGQTVAVELTWRDAAAAADPKSTAVLQRETKQVKLPDDGKPVAVEFTLKPAKLGRTTVNVAIKNPPAGDHVAVDNELDADVEVTERRNKVLLFASGASREYQFLRNQLQRILRSDGSKDKEFVVDVFLQTGSDGISQDSSEILADFPDTPALMFEYDCVIAFDPDWRKLSTTQMNLLREWVSDKAGGLIVVAGRIFTDATAGDPALSVVRALYPVEFGRVFALSGGTTARDKAWPIRFTEEGKRSEFLRLDDAEAAGLDPWVEFPGFYDYYPVKGVKDKAVVLAGLADPEGGATDGGRSYLMVEQAVGAGRVLYLGSGELWRLRMVNPGYFTRLYTQLVRHVAQARLLRDSKRGVLMVDHDNGRYTRNDVVEVRAQLTDQQGHPLKAEEVPLAVSGPDKSTSRVKLSADPALAGNFRGVFPVRQIGTFRLDLTLPDGNQELLTRRIQVRAPKKESDDIRLNQVLLERLSEATGGAYFAGVDAAMASTQPSLASRLPDQTHYTPRLAKPVSLWDNQWMLAGICSVLCLEWLVRRLAKLA